MGVLDKLESYVLAELNRVEQTIFDTTFSVAFELRVDSTDSHVHPTLAQTPTTICAIHNLVQ